MEQILPYGWKELMENPLRKEIANLKEELDKKVAKYHDVRQQLFNYTFEAMKLCFPTKPKRKRIETNGYHEYLVASRDHIGTQWDIRCHISDLDPDKSRNELLRHLDWLRAVAKKDKKEMFDRIVHFYKELVKTNLPTFERFITESFLYPKETDFGDDYDEKVVAVEIRHMPYIVIAKHPYDKDRWWGRDTINPNSFHDAIDYYHLFPTIKKLLLKAHKWMDEMLLRVEGVYYSKTFQWIKSVVDVYSNLKDL